MSKMNRKIIVFGATGNTGKKICEELDALDIKHAAFVRQGSEGKVETKLTEVIQGNVLEKGDVEKAISDKQFTDVIIALGSRDLNGRSVRSIGTHNIVEVLKENSLTSKLHVVSAHGVRESWKNLAWYEKLIVKLFLNNTMKDHELQENAVLKNPGGHHIIRPVALKKGPHSGNIFHQPEGRLPNGDITRSDVAKFLVDSMHSNKKGVISICKG